MSSSNVVITIGEEPEEVQLPLPEEPKKSIQYFAPQSLNAQGDFEMRRITNNIPSSSLGEDNSSPQDPRHSSRDENRGEERSGPMSEQIQTLW
jgi:hypothetical protein